VPERVATAMPKWGEQDEVRVRQVRSPEGKLPRLHPLSDFNDGFQRRSANFNEARYVYRVVAEGNHRPHAGKKFRPRIWQVRGAF
jgi:hypothetical protein